MTVRPSSPSAFSPLRSDPDGATGARHVPWTPLAAVTAAGLLGTFLPGGTVVFPPLLGAVAVLAVCVALVALPGVAGRRHSELAAALAYVGFVSLLTLAQGGAVKAGSYMLALLAVMWTALYGDRRAGAVLVVVSAGAQAGLAVLARQDSSVIVRKSLLWVLITAGITLAVHHLRDRFSQAIVERDITLDQTQALARALRELTVQRLPGDVLSTGTRVAAELVSGDPAGWRRAAYFVVDGDEVQVAYQHDESGADVRASWPLASHPPLQRVVQSRAPVTAELSARTLGDPAWRAVSEADVHFGAWVPIVHQGVLHGILGVAGRDRPIEGQSLNLLVSLGGAVELALANALANEALERLTKVDVLTGCVNRRGLEAAAVLQTSFAVIAVDLDGFKEINDTFGHEAGDMALTSFATTIQTAVRAEDIVARVGGDEFVVLLPGANAETGRQVVARILSAVEASMLSPAVRASLGVAVGGLGVAFEDVVGRADRAMYEAKRAGGMRWVEWSERRDDRVPPSIAV